MRCCGDSQKKPRYVWCVTSAARARLCSLSFPTRRSSDLAESVLVVGLALRQVRSADVASPWCALFVLYLSLSVCAVHTCVLLSLSRSLLRTIVALVGPAIRCCLSPLSVCLFLPSLPACHWYVDALLRRQPEEAALCLVCYLRCACAPMFSLFPYTTLFRSCGVCAGGGFSAASGAQCWRRVALVCSLCSLSLCL